MDQCTSIVRKNHWATIIRACQNRPADMSIRAWLAENGISHKTYYYWLRKFRKEAFSELSERNPELLDSDNSFAQISMNEPEPSSGAFSPDVVIKTHLGTIALSNSASPDLISLVMEGLKDAH